MTLSEAARTFPESLIQDLPAFLKAKQPFQYSLIYGLKLAWEDAERKPGVDWRQPWESIVQFFEHLVEDGGFWEETSNHEQRRDEITSALADFLRSGTVNDNHAYPTELLPRTRDLIAILLDKTRAAGQPSDDPMSLAINTPKGRTIEALFSQALRACRTSDRTGGSHETQWNDVRPMFEAELAKCKNSNYEFSTLSGAYIAQLIYLDPKWTKEQILAIFPVEFPVNSACAIDGLGYAPFTRPVYTLLNDSCVFDRALKYELEGRGGREKLLERIAAAYLWGDESLESARLAFIFESGRLEDLETITRVFWMMRSGSLTAENRERVGRYWRRCIEWNRRSPEKSPKLLSSLSMLSCFLASADGPERELLEGVAPYVHLGYNAYEFVNELVRLVEDSPDGVSVVLGKMIQTHVPDFDYLDQLKILLEALLKKGRRQDVISHAERLRSLAGMQEIFDRVTRGTDFSVL